VALKFLFAASQGCLIGLNFKEAPANFRRFLSGHAAMLVEFHGVVRVVRHARLPFLSLESMRVQPVAEEDRPPSHGIRDYRAGWARPPHRPEAVPSERAKLPWTEFAFADHPLVPVHFVFDSIMRRIALAEQNADDFKAALGGMLDTPLGEKFHCLADPVFVL